MHLARLRPLVIAAAVLALATPAAAQSVPALPRAPFPATPAARQLDDARRAIGQAGASAAAVRAQFAYRDAVTRYAAGDLQGARNAAVQARVILAEPAVGHVSAADIQPLVPSSPYGAPPQLGAQRGAGTPGAGAQIFPSTQLGTEPVGGALGVDEDELVARSRSAVANCAAKKPDELTAARRGFDAVWTARTAGNVLAERLAARALVRRCGVLF